MTVSFSATAVLQAQYGLSESEATDCARKFAEDMVRSGFIRSLAAPSRSADGEGARGAVITPLIVSSHSGRVESCCAIGPAPQMGLDVVQHASETVICVKCRIQSLRI
jgi:hypothetical protein